MKPHKTFNFLNYVQYCRGDQFRSLDFKLVEKVTFYDHNCSFHLGFRRGMAPLSLGTPYHARRAPN